MCIFRLHHSMMNKRKIISFALFDSDSFSVSPATSSTDAFTQRRLSHAGSKENERERGKAPLLRKKSGKSTRVEKRKSVGES